MCPTIDLDECPLIICWDPTLKYFDKNCKEYIFLNDDCRTMLVILRNFKISRMWLVLLIHIVLFLCPFPLYFEV